jgi:thiol-disulfide isomerase/thioredoxin
MRWVRRSTAAVCTGLLAVGLGTAPVWAKTAQRELSPRVKVEGKKLPMVTSDTIATSADPAIGKTAPTITGRGFDGQQVSFTNDGKPRILIFLSHSCPHCQAEVPRIVKLAKQGKLDGVEIDTITTNTSADLPNYPPSKWLKREHWPFAPVLADDAKLRAFFGYGGASFPYFVFVAADGTVVVRVAGELTPSLIAEAARRLAAGESLFGK